MTYTSGGVADGRPYVPRHVLSKLPNVILVKCHDCDVNDPEGLVLPFGALSEAY
jgi:hypothetical protein